MLEISNQNKNEFSQTDMHPIYALNPKYFVSTSSFVRVHRVHAMMLCACGTIGALMRSDMSPADAHPIYALNPELK